ncbi:hypothetical protein [Sphingobacterium bovistauri]|uniref:DUF3784 domain-containing protein n=1 Tax=Sphingobacterium bovistauri TaxID=2781959 RepID=A0ABS7Z2B9_9SPHI|nr:hypothetical protein [Sphingobacterium bovistauri]MCA5003752.1 hypothetical protein [Sphingobacterium bovistauri]
MIGFTELYFIVGVLILILVFVALLMSIYFFYKYKMANPSKSFDNSEEVKNIWVRRAIVVLGLAIGIIIAEILSNLGLMNSSAIYLSIILLCLGASMLVANKVDKKNSTEE